MTLATDKAIDPPGCNSPPEEIGATVVMVGVNCNVAVVVEYAGVVAGVEVVVAGGAAVVGIAVVVVGPAGCMVLH